MPFALLGMHIFVDKSSTELQLPLHLSRLRSVVRGGQTGLKPPFKYYRNTVFSLVLSQMKKRNFETPSKLIIP